jgi:hypothetical protein
MELNLNGLSVGENKRSYFVGKQSKNYIYMYLRPVLRLLCTYTSRIPLENFSSYLSRCTYIYAVPRKQDAPISHTNLTVQLFANASFQKRKDAYLLNIASEIPKKSGHFVTSIIEMSF